VVTSISEGPPHGDPLPGPLPSRCAVSSVSPWPGCGPNGLVHESGIFSNSNWDLVLNTNSSSLRALSSCKPTKILDENMILFQRSKQS
jgi:hypothetical protein